MSIAYDNSSSSTGTGFGTTLSHTTAGSNRILLVAVWEATPAVNTATVKYNGVSLIKIAQQIDSDRAISLWYLIAPTVGANTIALTGTGSYTVDILATSYTGAHQNGQPEASNTGTVASATTLSAAVTTLSDQSWLVGCFMGNGVTISAGTNTTFRSSQSSQVVAIGDSNGSQTPTGSYSLAMSANSTNNMGMILASIIPPSVSQTVSDATALQNLDVITQSFGFIQTIADSLGMAALDTIHSIYGWASQTKSAIGSWINKLKS